MFLTSISGPLTRLPGFLGFLLTVPLTTKYLGPERYGAWMSISGLITFLAFSDLGLGNSLVSTVSQAEGRGDRIFARQAISSVFFSLTGIGILVASSYLVSSRFIAWDWVLGLGSLRDHAEVQHALTVFVLIYSLGIPINTTLQVQNSLQSGYVSNLWATLGGTISFVLLYVAAIHHARIPLLVCTMSGGPLLTTLANSFTLYWIRRPDLRPSPRMFRPKVAREMLNRGVMFFGNGIASAMAYDSQLIIIAHLLGPAAVGVYAVVQRLFGMLLQMVNYLSLPLWPAFSEALAVKDFEWIKRALNRGLILNTAITAAPAIALAITGQRLIVMWTHGRILPPHNLLVGCCVWVVLFGLNCPQSMILNASHVLRFQLIASLTFGVATVAGMLLLLRVLGLGAASWIMVVAYASCMVLPMTLYIRNRFLDRLEAGVASQGLAPAE